LVPIEKLIYDFLLVINTSLKERKRKGQEDRIYIHRVTVT